MLTSIVKRRHGYAALCDDCGLPIERPEDGRWSSAEPLIRQTRASEQDSRMQAGRSLSRAPFPSRAASTQWPSTASRCRVREFRFGLQPSHWSEAAGSEALDEDGPAIPLGTPGRHRARPPS